MQVWDVLHAARWNTGRKNSAKSPVAHHRTTLLGYIFATKANIDNQKKVVKDQYLIHMSRQYGALRPTNGWDRFGGLGHPSKFQRVSRLAFVTAATSLTGGQPNFARCLTSVSWAGTLYNIQFWGLLSPDGILTGAKFTLRPSLAFSHGTITTQAGVSQALRRGTRNGITKLSQRAPPIFSWMAITLGIGTHSNYIIYHHIYDLAKIDIDLNQSFNGWRTDGRGQRDRQT